MVKPILVVVITALVVTVAIAQQKLTNLDVLSMLKAGLPEGTIVLSIEKSNSDFDTSAQALIALKNAGATQKVLDAVLLHDRGSVPSPSPVPVTKGASIVVDPASMGFPQLNAVLSDGTQKVSLKALNYSGTKADVNAKTWIPIVGLFSKSKGYARYAGNHSDVRTKNHQADFEVSAGSQQSMTGYVFVVKLEVKDSERRVMNTKVGIVGGASTGYDKKVIIEVSVQELATTGNGTTKNYRVRPLVPLPAGEYALAVGPVLYDFGVDP